MQLKAVSNAVNKNVNKIANNVNSYGVDTKFLELSKKNCLLLKEINDIEDKIASKVKSFQYVGWKQESDVKNEIQQLKKLLKQREMEYKQSISNTVNYWKNEGHGKTLMGEKYVSG